jgi:uncharacterized tellurite resistance protein B-like protein
VIDLIKKLVGTGAREAGKSAPEGAPGGGGGRDVHLAACAVLLEMAKIDNEFDEREREHIVRVFEKEYGLSPDVVRELEKAAAEQLARSKDYWTLTNVINRNFNNEEKYRLVELLWELVYSDGKMDEHENYFIHKLAKLLQLTHRDLIDAKLAVLHRHASSKEGEGGSGGWT